MAGKGGSRVFRNSKFKAGSAPTSSSTNETHHATTGTRKVVTAQLFQPLEQEQSKSTGGKEIGKEDCKHHVVHANCKCSPKAFYGVCVKCYDIFCSQSCLDSGIKNGSGRIGKTSEDILKKSYRNKEPKGNGETVKRDDKPKPLLKEKNAPKSGVTLLTRKSEEKKKEPLFRGPTTNNLYTRAQTTGERNNAGNARAQTANAGTGSGRPQRLSDVNPYPFLVSDPYREYYNYNPEDPMQLALGAQMRSLQLESSNYPVPLFPSGRKSAGYGSFPTSVPGMGMAQSERVRRDPRRPEIHPFYAHEGSRLQRSNSYSYTEKPVSVILRDRHDPLGLVQNSLPPPFRGNMRGNKKQGPSNKPPQSQNKRKQQVPKLDPLTPPKPKQSTDAKTVVKEDVSDDPESDGDAENDNAKSSSEDESNSKATESSEKILETPDDDEDFFDILKEFNIDNIQCESSSSPCPPFPETDEK